MAIRTKSALSFWEATLLFTVAVSVFAASEIDLGLYTLNVTTEYQNAQTLFNEGINHEFGFNQAESQKAFEKCRIVDEMCAMCEWGLAYSFGPFLNKPVLTKAEYLVAASASERALNLVKKQNYNVTLKEKFLIQAMSERYPVDGNQTVGAMAYVSALRRFSRMLPDADMLTFFAEALMDLTPASYYQNETMRGPGRLKASAAEAMSTLEEALQLSPSHPLALHLYIHLTEPGFPGFVGSGVNAGRGNDAADHLAALNITGSGHLEHMPGHLYLRVGRYAAAVESNRLAHLADDLYVANDMSPYGPGHNTYFLIYAACMDGQSQTALDYGQVLRDIYTRDPTAPDSPGCSTGWNLPLTSLLRFGGAERWSLILADTTTTPGGENATNNPFSAVLRAYSRGMANAALNATAEAVAELESLRSLVPSVETLDEANRQLAHVANLTLSARLTVNSDPMGAVDLLQKAVGLQDSWKYSEPPPWHFPLRQCLGTVQLVAGKVAAAERTFRDDLKQYLMNAWSLLGLKLAMLQQPDVYGPLDIATIDAAIQMAWKRADVPLKSPCPFFA